MKTETHPLSVAELDEFLDAIFGAAKIQFAFVTTNEGLSEVREAARKLYDRGFDDGSKCHR